MYKTVMALCLAVFLAACQTTTKTTETISYDFTGVKTHIRFMCKDLSDLDELIEADKRSGELGQEAAVAAVRSGKCIYIDNRLPPLTVVISEMLGNYRDYLDDLIHIVEIRPEHEQAQSPKVPTYAYTLIIHKALMKEMGAEYGPTGEGV